MIKFSKLIRRLHLLSTGAQADSMLCCRSSVYVQNNMQNRRWSNGSDLSELRLDQKSVSDQNMPAVIKTLTNADAVNKLRRLELRRNKIGFFGSSLLTQWMRPACNLELLNMWDNMLGDKGTRIISSALSAASRLRVLNLGSNFISDEGVVSLAVAVEKHQASNLRTLNLSFNSVSDQGVRTLTSALAHNSSIREIDLAHNASITPQAGTILIPMPTPICVPTFHVPGVVAGNRTTRLRI